MLDGLRFAPPLASVHIPSEVLAASADPSGQVPDEVLAWVDTVAHLLDTLPTGVVFKIGELRLDLNSSRRLVLTIADDICRALRSRGAPQDLAVEVDRIRPVKVWDHQTRTLLPHNDGAHCSYLTPKTHKLYQGIFILDPGDAISVTTYYDWLQVLRDAFARATGGVARSIDQIQHWLGINIRSSLDAQSVHMNRYLSIGAALGSRDVAAQGVVVHAAEEVIGKDELQRFPVLSEMIDDWKLAKDDCLPRTRFLSKVLAETLGLSWQEFRQRYELCVTSERFDYVLAHNLTLLHGGLMGGATRQLEPICFVLEQPAGMDYEQWLAAAWRRQVEESELALSE
jgi:hypothetical protein